MPVLLEATGSAPLDGTAPDPTFGLLSALCALVLLGALLWLALRLRATASTRGSTTMRVEERLALDLRGALLIVRVDQKRLLLATSDRGPARLLAELPTEPAQGKAESP